MKHMIFNYALLEKKIILFLTIAHAWFNLLSLAGSMNKTTKNCKNNSGLKVSHISDKIIVQGRQKRENKPKKRSQLII